MFPEDQILAAVYLFESAKGVVLDAAAEAELSKSPLRNKDPETIAVEIKDSLDNENDLSDAYRSAAFWALGKRFDSELLDLFRRHLAIEIDRDMQVAYQIMIALANLSEPVWPADQRSFSILSEERNRAAAIQYLRSCGQES